MKRRSKALWAVAALLAVNAVLVGAQLRARAARAGLGAYFFGPKLVRAEVLLKDAAGCTTTASTAARSAPRRRAR